MKELSIEEKARRYDEAFERAQRFYNNSVAITKKGLEDIFSELKESEDERIRKSIIKHFRQGTCYTSFYGFSKDKIIAWLEKQKVLTTEKDLQGKEDVLWCIKQAKKHAKDENEMGTCWFAEKWLEKKGEQKSLDDIAKEVTKDKDAAVSFLKSTGIINENGELADEYKIEQGEQKFSWSEEDKKMSRFIGNAITADDASTYLESKGIQVIDAHVWLDELKDRVQLKQEWSEEDGKIIIQIKKALEDFFLLLKQIKLNIGSIPLKIEFNHN